MSRCAPEFLTHLTISGVTAVGQAVECATAVSRSFSSDKALDGLVGLGGKIRNQVSSSYLPFFILHLSRNG